MGNYLTSQEINLKNRCQEFANRVSEKMAVIRDASYAMRDALEEYESFAVQANELKEEVCELLKEEYSKERNLITLSLLELSYMHMPDVSSITFEKLGEKADINAHNASIIGSNINDTFLSMEYNEETDL